MFFLVVSCHFIFYCPVLLPHWLSHCHSWHVPVRLLPWHLNNLPHEHRRLDVCLSLSLPLSPVSSFTLILAPLCVTREGDARTSPGMKNIFFLPTFDSLEWTAPVSFPLVQMYSISLVYSVCVCVLHTFSPMQWQFHLPLFSPSSLLSSPLLSSLPLLALRPPLPLPVRLAVSCPSLLCEERRCSTRPS